jgi:hypothetical protein
MNAGDFAPTLLADIVLAALAIEAAWLVAVCRTRCIDVVCALAPGLFLALALRAALADAPLLLVALFLAASGPAHLADLARRRLIGRRPENGHAQTIPRTRKASASASE